MNTTLSKITDSDYSTLFKNDPETFFEAVLINLLWQDEEMPKIDMELVNRQKHVFMKWLSFYTESIKEQALSDPDYQDQLNIAMLQLRDRTYNQTRLETLRNLPTKGKFTKNIDIEAVNILIKELSENEQRS